MSQLSKILSERVVMPQNEANIVRSELEWLFKNAGDKEVVFQRVGSVALDAARGLSVLNPDTGAEAFHADAGGNMFVGSNIDDPSTTSFLVVSEAQTYNDEALGAGDALFGDNSSGKANLLWDVSAGQLKFRGGTTVNTYIDVDGTIHATSGVFSGTITATAGAIGGWDITSTQIKKSTTIVLDSSVPSISVAGGNVLLNSSGITAVAGEIGGWTIGATTLASANITLDDGNDKITVNTITIDGANNRIVSNNYSAGVSGWRVGGDDKAEFQDVVVRGEIRSSVFTTSEIAATGGTQVIAAAVGRLYSDFAVPGTTGTLAVADKAGTTASPFSAGQRIRIKTPDGDAWGVITGGSDQDGYTNYTWTWNAGSTGWTAKAGTALIAYNNLSGGTIYLSADGTIGSSANITIAEHSGDPFDETVKVVLGNLNGSYGVSSNYWGVGLGDYASGNYLTYNSDGSDKFLIQAGGGGVTIDENGVTVPNATEDPTTTTKMFRIANNSTGDVYGGLYGTADGLGTEIILFAHDHINSGAIPSVAQSTVYAKAGTFFSYFRVLAYADGDTFAELPDYSDGLAIGYPAGTAPNINYLLDVNGSIQSKQAIVAAIDGSSGGFYGGASQDVQLYRSGLNQWYTPDNFSVGGFVSVTGLISSATSTITSAVNGSSGGFKAGGAGDVHLYRNAADQWYTPDQFWAGGALISSSGVYSQGDGSSYGLFAGASNDVQWYRNSANIWRTPDSVWVDGQLLLSSDTALYASAANLIYTPDNFRAAGYLYSDAANALYLRNDSAKILMGSSDDIEISRYAANQLFLNDHLIIQRGLAVGSTRAPTADNISYDGNLASYKNSADYAVYGYHPLTSRVESANFNGDSYSTAAKTLIDVSSEFGFTTANIKAYLLQCFVRDSGSDTTSARGICLDPTNTADLGVFCMCTGLANDAIMRNMLVVHTDANGDFYIQKYASGTNTLDIWIQIYGYWI